MYNACMTVAMQIRDVPDQVRDALAAEAARRGQSTQAYLLALVVEEAKAITNADMFFRMAPLRVDLSAVDIVGMIRQGRDDGFEVDRDA